MTAAVDETEPEVAFGHLSVCRVRIDDLDPFGVMHNSRYALVVERAIEDYWADRGYAFVGTEATKPDVYQFAREMTVGYLQPVRGAGDLVCHFWLEKMGRTSAEYGFRMLSPDRETTYAEGSRVVVRIDPATGRPTSWTQEGRDMAAALIRPVDAGL
ncbi:MULTISPECIES: thioesterase family protein [Actinoplanes]|uniref:acyl-CoA thioesterase n=1 Tax=Actinoplanes TaxID=1865 RepID=UPI0005F2F24E|nr:MULTISPECIES: thioesterase family protein [Actinoplanes]GLY02323.1 hypothetical protein Acsp01_27020 [Actinoplanes sp. NBRC 101535]